MPFTEDDITPAENQKYKALAAAGNQQALMDYINTLSCKYDHQPANFGDGSHRTCPNKGGRKRTNRKQRKSRKSRKSRKYRKSRKSRKSRK